MNNLKKIPLILLILSLSWSILLYLTPATLKPGTVNNLDGNANMVDNQDTWRDLPIGQAFIYYVGDLHCHQKANRSFIINGNQMPVCVRDVGIFLGCKIGICLVFLVNTKISPTRSFLNLFLKEKKVEKLKNRKIIVGIILIASALPVIVDGLVQGFTDYESTNNVRLLTGMLFGIIFSYAFTVLVTSINER